MRSISTISKVSPLEVPQVKQNNYLYKGLNIVKQFKYIIYFESMLGISRLYLLKFNKCVQWFNYLYVFTLTAFSLLVILSIESSSSSHMAVRNVLSLEYVLLVVGALTAKKKKLLNLFGNLSQFDEMIKISFNDKALTETKRSLMWIGSSFTYNAVEFLLMYIYIYQKISNMEKLAFIFYCTLSMAHDTEQIFFFTLLRIIFMRLRLVNAHVTKVFGVNDTRKNNKNTDIIEMLSNNTQLDIDSLHKVYELLHKCSEQLNSIMSFPMMVILFTSGMTTTMLLKILVKVIQINDALKPQVLMATVVYILVRCIKYTLLVVVPCYYSSITSAQVTTIRTTLHDSLNTIPLDKLERRRVKAFFLLTKENEFAYALAGVIRLNMTLPLSYTSLCTTYLVIIIQFSKFLD